MARTIHPLRYLHEVVMASNGIPLTWQQLLAKHGPWALGCAVMGYVIFTFILAPSQKEREAFIETSGKNAEAMHIVAESTKDVSSITREIRNLIERQEATQLKMSEELEKQSVMRAVALESMSAFAKEMREVNPANSLKLDLLLKQAKKTDDNDKLDIIIEKINTILEESNQIL